MTARTHFKDWPNAAGFNALGDTRTKVELEVSGHFPDYVAGSLFRTGPGGYKVPREDPKDGQVACSHWFDGFSTVHKFELVPDGEKTRAWYSSYCQVDELIEHARKTGKLEGVTFGQKRDPCDTLYRKVKSFFEPVLPGNPHTMNIGVALRKPLPAELARLPGNTPSTGSRSIMTLTTDSHQTKQFDLETLEPLGVTEQSHLHPALTGPISAAHAAKDPVTGDMYNYNLDFGVRQTYRVFQANPSSGEVKILAEISGHDIRGAYIHSLFLTENFVILCVWPAYFSTLGLSILWNRNLLDAIAPFDPNAKATWLVVDRHHNRGLVKKFTSPAFFCFHTTNAWEEPLAAAAGHSNTVDLVCELVQFKNTDILHRFYYENMVSDESNVANRASGHGEERILKLARYRLAGVPLPTPASRSEPATSRSPEPTSTAEQILSIPSPAAGDLPNYNPRYTFKPHRYVWSIVNRGYSSFIDGLVKTDTRTRTGVVWDHPKHTPGEPIFVPDPEGEAEDDGVILSVVLDGEKGTSYLLCLDARDMRELGRARVGTAVGFGFHGAHVPASGK